MSADTPAAFAAAVGMVRSPAGGFLPGRGAVVRGRDLHRYAHDRRWFELYLMALTGRQFAAREVELLETLWTYTSYPDPRIWNNRVAALAGSAGSSAALAIGAAIAVSDAHIYGLGPIMEAFELLSELAPLDDDALLEAVRARLRARRRFGGYGRPIIAEDERIAPLMSRAKALGLADGRHVTAAFRVESALLAAGRPLKINYGAPVAAFCLDLAFTRAQCEAFVATLFLGGMPPVWLEAAAGRVAGALLPIPSSMLEYEGPAARRWPAARQRD